MQGQASSKTRNPKAPKGRKKAANHGTLPRAIVAGELRTGDLLRIGGKVRQVLATFPGGAALAYLGGGVTCDSSGQEVGRLMALSPDDEPGAYWLRVEIEHFSWRGFEALGAERVEIGNLVI